MTTTLGFRYGPRENYFDTATDTYRLLGWTVGDGSRTDGYHVEDYFGADGHYLGPDEHGIEPILETAV
jgi:hypothetical protein